ncbi:MAG: glycosyl transferase family 2 [Ruminococcaceae bacterium]|nr:glycosyl transferase family 2 [Oscillospiraceae bacterium]
MKDTRLSDILLGREDNYLLPFYWQHGTHRDRIPAQIQRIYNSGCRAVCVESRPHPDFCGPDWWADMDIILAECEKRDMKVWVLDDKRFPTGFANGLIAKKYPHLRQWEIIEEHIDVLGPAPGTAFLVSKVLPDDEILGVYGCERNGFGEFIEGNFVDLTPTITEGYAYWDVPAGIHRVFVYTKSRRGIRDPYIDMTSYESCSVQIEAVYEPHYEHYAKYFGNTFIGFFSDEPSFGNSMATRHPVDPSGHERPLGTVGMALPYNPKVIELMTAEMGEYALPYMAELWYPSDHAPVTRLAYMNAVTKLYRDNFSYRLGNWCREHGVMYIGHIIEDNNCHARLAVGAGHYFRALEGQDMAGIDIVLHQVMPGMAHHIHNASLSTGISDPAFYHYVLGQLGASLAHQYPQMKGRAMCEEFGAYGWAEGATMMKWITDFLLVRGINHFVPHAFSPDYPDPDCPPHFGAEGHDPQFEGFTHLMKYTNKAAHLLYGGTHITSCAIFYHAEGEWMNNKGGYMFTQVPAKRLLDNHLCYDIICLDTLEKATVADGNLVINGEHYGALVIPYARVLPDALSDITERLTQAGVPVLFCDGKPNQPENMCGEVVWIANLADRIRELGLADVTVEGNCPLLRHYHVKREDADIFMFFNEDSMNTAKATVTLPASGKFMRLRLIENGAFADMTEDGKVTVELLPCQSEILVFGSAAEEMLHPHIRRLSVPVKITTLTPSYEISLADSDDLTEFCLYKTTDTLVNITAASEKPSFSGLIRYTFTLDLDEVPTNAVLDLGRVGQTAKFLVNGTEAGIRITAPYSCPISYLLHKGKNTLTIEVANTLVGKVRDPFSHCMPIPPSGLLGPVKLLEY